MTHPSLPDMMWHGTSPRNARLIARAGLLFPSRLSASFGSSGACREVHLSDSRDVALHFARVTAQRHRTPPVLLAVPSAALDPARLVPDVHLMLAPARRPRFYPEASPHDASWLRRAALETWQDSLAKVSGVGSTAPVVLDDVLVDSSVSSMPPFASDTETILSENGGWPGGVVMPDTPVLERLAPPFGPAVGTLLEAGSDTAAKPLLLDWAIRTLVAIAGTKPDNVRLETSKDGATTLKAPLQVYRAIPLLADLEAAFDPWRAPIALTGRRTREGHHDARVFLVDRVWIDSGEQGRFASRPPGLCVTYACRPFLCSDARVQEARAAAQETVEV